MTYTNKKHSARSSTVGESAGFRPEVVAFLRNADGRRARKPVKATNAKFTNGDKRPASVKPRRSAAKHRVVDESLELLQLLTVSDVCKWLRISKPTLWRLRRARNFPEPTSVTERIFGWPRREIDAWLASRSNPRRY